MQFVRQRAGPWSVPQPGYIDQMPAIVQQHGSGESDQFVCPKPACFRHEESLMTIKRRHGAIPAINTAWSRILFRARASACVYYTPYPLIQDHSFVQTSVMARGQHAMKVRGIGCLLDFDRHQLGCVGVEGPIYITVFSPNDIFTRGLLCHPRFVPADPCFTINTGSRVACQIILCAQIDRTCTETGL